MIFILFIHLIKYLIYKSYLFIINLNFFFKKKNTNKIFTNLFIFYYKN